MIDGGNIKFISNPTGYPKNYSGRHFNGGPMVRVEHTIMSAADDSTLDEILEEFQRFLLAIGYSFKGGDYLAIVNDDNDEKTKR